MPLLPKTAILYITHAAPNWRRDIDRCLRSLERLNYPRDRVELICAESYSELGPVKPWFDEYWMSKSGKELPRITYIDNYNRVIGFAGNNNVMFEKARELGCDYVYLLNQDTDVDPDFLLKAMERAEQDSQIAYVQSLLLLGDDRERVNTVGNAFHYLAMGYSRGYLWTRASLPEFFAEERKRNPDLEIGYWSGAGVLGRVSAIEKTGLFDEGFFLYHEDTDASFQAKARGWKVVVEPSSIVYHFYEFSKSRAKFYWIERNRFVMMFSYYRPWTLALILPMLIVLEIAMTIFSFKGGWWREKLRAYRDLLRPSFWFWILKRRAAIQAARTVPDRELLRGAVSTVEFQGEAVKNPVLTYIGNPLMRGYWAVISKLL